MDTRKTAVIILSFVCLFVLGFYDPVNEVMSSRSVYSGTIPGQA